MALNAYLSQTQSLLHDSNSQFYSTAQLTTYVNQARAKTAAAGQCCRAIPQNFNTIAAQETYSGALANSLLSSGQGLQSVLGVVTIAVNIGSSKPTLRRYSWTAFQAYLRSYSIGLQGYPMVFAQFGSGIGYSDLATQNNSYTGFTVYLWPIPSSAYPMDWDCYCLPVPLTSDATPEAIPYPFSDAVPFYAASLALRNAQRKQDANDMEGEWIKRVRQARSQSDMLFIPDMYGI